MHVSIFEQETTIQMSRDSEKAYIWTSDSRMIYKLDKKCEEEGSVWKCTKIDYFQGTTEVASKEYEVDKKMIRFLAKPPKRRELTEEEKEALRERMLRMQEARRRALSGEDDDDEEEMDRLEAEIEDLEGDDDD